MYMSVLGNTFSGVFDPVVIAHYLPSGVADGTETGDGKIGWLRGAIGFGITREPLSGEGIVACEPISMPQETWALRLDEVAFPVGAIAHRHTHSGSGWRHLVTGSLRIEAEHGTTVMKVGDSWFEPAHNPVRAVALQDTGVTRFVRCMVIPIADVGHSTFKLQSPKDADLPRLQTTVRHFDHVFQVEA